MQRFTAAGVDFVHATQQWRALSLLALAVVRSLMRIEP
jgi:hypothetical protein